MHDTRQHEDDPQPVALSRAELNSLMREAASAGAKEALASIGLHDEDAAGDVRDLRSLLEAIRSAKKTAWQTAIKIVTTAALAALIAGLSLKAGVWGPPR